MAAGFHYRQKRVYPATVRQPMRCTCPNGHYTNAQVFVSINMDIDPQETIRLAVSGLQSIVCSICKVSFSIAEPVIIHQPARERAALYIPEFLTHRETEFRAGFFTETATADPNRIEPYLTDAITLVGLASLKSFIGDISNENNKFSTTGKFRKTPQNKNIIPHENLKHQPEILDAFTDLGASDSVPPPILSNPPSYSGELSASVLEDDLDDWLEDGVLDSSNIRPSVLPESKDDQKDSKENNNKSGTNNFEKLMTSDEFDKE